MQNMTSQYLKILIKFSHYSNDKNENENENENKLEKVAGN